MFARASHEPCTSIAAWSSGLARASHEPRTSIAAWCSGLDGAKRRCFLAPCGPNILQVQDLELAGEGVQHCCADYMFFG
eukprot:352427-Chlamydomonas_euryale.AAC.2